MNSVKEVKLEIGTLERMLETYRTTQPVSDTTYSLVASRLERLNSECGLEMAVINDSAGIVSSHLKRLLSLDATQETEYVENWCNSVQDIFDDELFEYSIEVKADAVSVCVIYTNGCLTKVVTKGNGVSGVDITSEIERVVGLPRYIPGCSDATIEFSGALVAFDALYAAYNHAKRRKGLPVSTNIRKYILNSLGPAKRINPAKRVGFLCYDINWISDGMVFDAQSDLGVFLSSLGFSHAISKKIYYGKQEVIAAVHDFNSNGIKLKQYAIDGIVIKPNNIALKNTLASNGEYPAAAVMYKKPSSIMHGFISKVNWCVGETGLIFPVAYIVVYSGSKEREIMMSLDNLSAIEKLGIRNGDTVRLGKAGGATLQIKNVFSRVDDDPLKIVTRPRHCPRCHSPVVSMDKGETIWCGSRSKCRVIQVNRFTLYNHRKGIYIEGLNHSLTLDLINDGFLTNPMDIYNLRDFHMKQFVDRGYDARTISNLLKEIDRSKKTTLDKLIYSLGIYGIGPVTAISLMKYFGTIDALSRASIEDLMRVDNVGQVIASEIWQYFDNKANLSMVLNIARNGLLLEEPVTPNGFRLKNERWFVRGTFKSMTYSEVYKILYDLGATIDDCVSSKTTAILIGGKYDVRLDKAHLIDINVYTEKDFLRFLSSMGIVFDEEEPC